MATPADFGFSEEAQMLRDAARKFFADNLPVDRLHRLVAGDPDPNRAPQCLWDRELWRQIADLGWTALAVPERAGGLGMPLVAAAALMEEAGRAAFPGPLLPTFAASYLLGACESAAADLALEAIVAGAAATLALTDARGAWRSGGDVECRDGGLYGTAYFVQDACKADFFVVKARLGERHGLWRVDAGAAGLDVRADAIVDLTRDQARLVFDGALASAELAPPGASDAIIAAIEPALFTLIAADLCGAAEWLLQTTAEYARVRKQFERPIGFFQAIKHPLVDVMTQIDQARSHVYNAGCVWDHDRSAAARAAHMAKSAAGDAAVFGAGRAVQFHGGIGFTWECFVHLYFKRQMHNTALFGDPAWHRARLAELLLDAA